MTKKQEIIIMFTRDENAPTADELERILSEEYNLQTFDHRGIGGGDLGWLPHGLTLVLAGPLFWTSKKIFEKLGDDAYEAVKKLLFKSREKLKNGEYIIGPVNISIKEPSRRMLLKFSLPPYSTQFGDESYDASSLEEVGRYDQAIDEISAYYKLYHERIASTFEPLISDETLRIELKFDSEKREWKIHRIGSEDP